MEVKSELARLFICHVPSLREVAQVPVRHDFHPTTVSRVFAGGRQPLLLQVAAVTMLQIFSAFDS